MGQILERVKSLAEAGEIRVSRHGFRELAADDIVLDEVILGIPAAVQVEEYAEFAKGPAVLVMQRDTQTKPIHIVWGISRDQAGPAVLVTAYRPDPKRWSADFMRRVKS